MNNNFKGLVFLLCLCFGIKANAQYKVGLAQHQSLFYALDTTGIFALSTRLDAQSGAHNFNYIQSFYSGKFINTQLIDENSKMLKLQNRLGIETAIDGRYFFGSQINKKGNVSAHYIKATYNQIVGGRYNSDAWLLAMKGNAPFAGDEVALNKLGIAQYEWLALGWGKKGWNLNKTIAVTAGVDLIGGKANGFNLSSGSIYTDTAGEYIDVDLNGNWSKSNNAGYSAGLGATFGLQGAIKNKSEWHLSFSDFGVLLPHKHNQSNSFDTSFRFTGFYVYDVKRMTDNDYWTDITDSLSAPISTAENTKKTTILPFKLEFGINTFIRTNQQVGMLISYRHLVYAMPKIEVWHTINYGSGFYLNSSLAYGGWGGIQWSEKVGFQTYRLAIGLQLGGMQSMAIQNLPFQTTAQIQLVTKF